MKASIVEEVKVDVLHKKPFRIPDEETTIRLAAVKRLLRKVTQSQLRRKSQGFVFRVFDFRQRMWLLAAVVHVLDHSWRKSLQSQCVVNGDGDPARHARVTTDDTANFSLEGKMAALVFCHFHPVHPLKDVKTLHFELFFSL